MSPTVHCDECGHDVELPGGLALSGGSGNPDWKGVSCPWCYEDGNRTILPASKVAAAFGVDLEEP